MSNVTTGEDPILQPLFTAADEHAAGSGHFDYAIGDLQEHLRTALSLMTAHQQQAFWTHDKTQELLGMGDQMDDPVKKTVITVVVLHRETDDIDGMDLEEIARGMRYENFLGEWQITSSTLVPESMLHDEQVALGNDGTFFENDED